MVLAMLRLFLLLTLLAAPARADFVLSNLRFTLYHEAAHAVIDQHNLALTGPEETAADGFAIFVMHRLYPEAEMQEMIQDVVELGRHDALGELFDPWSQYMPGNQRLSWALCLYYGLAPDQRGPFARAIGMPPDRAESCEESATRLRAFWDPVLRKHLPQNGEISFTVRRAGKSLRLLKDDIARLNRTVKLPREVPIRAESCGEDNAFYYPYDERIVFCTEMVVALRAARR